MYIRAMLQSNGDRAEERVTDRHWRVPDGRGFFNWRMKWAVQLPAKYLRLTVQGACVLARAVSMCLWCWVPACERVRVVLGGA